ncbi:MAG: ComF family protein [Defluviitaleaceae bacterium]|nr:ComF family protein [Defluviitaleaceae bacterium]
MDYILDWLYPPTCAACRVLLPLNEPRRFFCARCESLFVPISAPLCARCSAPASIEATACPSCFGKNYHFEKNFASFVYDELLRELLHDIKFREKKRVAEALGWLWAKNCLHFPEDIETFTMVPMPMHAKKKRERGFNQAEILTLPLAAALKIPMSNVLVRTVDTPPQSEVHPSQRAENVRNVFEIRKNAQVVGKNFILTDDIFTTGASLNECARILKNCGAARVLCMNLAITVKN